MATKAAISLEEHLRTPYEREPEYVDGMLEERPFGTIKHGELQSRIAAALRRVGFRTVGSEITILIAPAKTRIPAVIAYVEKRREAHPSVPPFVAVEIFSPGDSVDRVSNKLEEYAQFGVRHLWLVAPETEKLFVYSVGVLVPVDEFQVPELDAIFTARELFDDL
ncbi:MAG: Uma2 family endonuclease [Acidobacteria bacterium]|nr:Uma2 family endonuclease [Acidobacteriota bacterium]